MSVNILKMDVPVIINNRDLLTWPKAMLEKIKSYDGVGEIIIVDNGSTYEPLLDWYATKPCRIEICTNLGMGAPWVSGVVEKLNTDYYVVTDPDLGLEDTPANTLIELKYQLMKNPDLGKVGLGLNFEIVGKDSPYYNHMKNYEYPRWFKSPVINGVYTGVPIDTTFAMYNRKQYFIGGGSLTWPYVARHYPWELTKAERDKNSEFIYYLEHATDASSYKTYFYK